MIRPDAHPQRHGNHTLILELLIQLSSHSLSYRQNKDKSFWKNWKCLTEIIHWCVTRVWARAYTVGEWLWLKGHASGARAFVDQTSPKTQRSTDFLDFSLASRDCANHLQWDISSKWTRHLSFCNGGCMFLVCCVIYFRACHIFSDMPNGQR